MLLWQGDWFCPLCVQQGITTKPEPLPLQPKQVRAACCVGLAALQNLEFPAVPHRGGASRLGSHALPQHAGLPPIALPRLIPRLAVQLGALKPPKTSVKTRPSSTSKLGKRADGHEGSQGSAPPTKRAPSAAAAAPGRVHMAAPTAPRAPRLGRPGARSNKNKRLFEGEEGALINGQKLYYKTTQVRAYSTSTVYLCSSMCRQRTQPPGLTRNGTALQREHHCKPPCGAALPCRGRRCWRVWQWWNVAAPQASSAAAATRWVAACGSRMPQHSLRCGVHTFCHALEARTPPCAL